MRNRMLLITLLFLGIMLPQKVFSQSKTVLYFFWGDGCPHCENAKPFLERLEKKFPSLEVRSLETWKNSQNAETFKTMARAYGTMPSGVPAFFIGSYEPIVGFGDKIIADITEKVRTCIKGGCVNPDEKAGLTEVGKSRKKSKLLFW